MLGAVKVQILHLASPIKQNMDGGEATREGVSKQLFLPTLLQKPRDGTPPLLRMPGHKDNLGFSSNKTRGSRAATATLAPYNIPGGLVDSDHPCHGQTKKELCQINSNPVLLGNLEREE